MGLVYVMSRLPVISTPLIFALFIVSTVLSAPREDIIQQQLTNGEFHKTREAQVVEKSSEYLRNERFDVSREEQLLRRLQRVAKEPVQKFNESDKSKLAITELPIFKSTNNNSVLNEDKTEIKDMIKLDVTPKYNDDTPKNQEKTLSMMEKGTTPEARDTKVNPKPVTELAPVVFPVDNKTADIRIVSPEWLEKLNKTKYTTDQTETNTTANKTETSTESVVIVTISSTSTELQAHINESATMITAPKTITVSTAITDPSTITTAPIITALIKKAPPATAPTPTLIKSMTSIPTNGDKLIDNPIIMTNQPTSSTPSPDELKLHEKPKPVPVPMPKAVVILITIISFTIIGIVTYIALLARRRYFEWRYGNRELLINDFDAVDNTNFEL